MALLEMFRHAIRSEPRPLGVDVTIAKTTLARGEETLRHYKMKLILSSRHCDVEQPPLFLDLGRRADAEIRGNAAIHDIEHKDRGPTARSGFR